MCEPPFSLWRNDETNEAEYPVEMIIRHMGTGNDIRYVVRWYRYQSLEDTFKTPHRMLRCDILFPDICTANIVYRHN